MMGENFSGTIADIADEELLRRAVRSCRKHRGSKPMWSVVADRFALGSTYAGQLCRRFDLDPDSGKPLMTLPSVTPSRETNNRKPE